MKNEVSLARTEGLVDTLNFLPNDNFLDWTKFKAFADDKLNGANIEIFFERVENMVSSIFSFSHDVFRWLLSQGC